MPLADGWTLGPSTFVALGTLALAVVTFQLVRATVKLATASAADVQAQWRPVLLPRAVDVTAVDATAVTVTFVNDGRGPALFLLPSLSGVGQGKENIALEGIGPTVIETGRTGSFEFPAGALSRKIFSGEITIAYRDLTGRAYSTSFYFSPREESSPGDYQFHAVRIGLAEGVSAFRVLNLPA